MNPELLGCHFGSGDAIGYLLKRDVTSVIGRAVIGLRVDTEWRETTIVCGAKPLLVDIFGRSDQLVANFLRCLGARTLGHDAADICHLRDPISVIPQVFTYQLISRLAIALAGHFHLT